MVLLTVFTVGYGEVRPIATPFLHFVTIATIVLGSFCPPPWCRR
jgi:voltage-gated potassium channel